MKTLPTTTCLFCWKKADIVGIGDHHCPHCGFSWIVCNTATIYYSPPVFSVILTPIGTLLILKELQL